MPIKSNDVVRLRNDSLCRNTHTLFWLVEWIVPQQCDWTYEPGDTIGVVCPNSDDDVNFILSRLGLTSLADAQCSLQLIDADMASAASSAAAAAPSATAAAVPSAGSMRGKRTSLPEHLPPVSSPRRILQTCCEIRDVPRKVRVWQFICSCGFVCLQFIWYLAVYMV